MMFLHQTLRAGLVLTAVAALAACSKDEAHDDHDHEHTEGGGHAHDPIHEGGVLMELGDHFANLEAVHDAETGSLTIFAIDFHSDKWPKSPTESLKVTLETHDGDPIEVTLAADVSELRGNKKGASSQFSAEVDALKGLDHFHGTVAEISVKGQVFKDVRFDFGGGHDDDGEEHDGHDHDGEDHDEDGHDHDGDDHDHDKKD